MNCRSNSWPTSSTASASAATSRPNPFVWFTLSVRRRRCRCGVAGAARLADGGVCRTTASGVPAEHGVLRHQPAGRRGQTFQIRPSPIGVDAIYAWQIAGGAGDNGRVGDIESGWRLDHEELITQKITRRSVFGVEIEINHGTGVAGILVGADNGVGTVGIVPNAELELFSRDTVERDSKFRQRDCRRRGQPDRRRRSAARGRQQLLRRRQRARHPRRVRSGGAAADPSGRRSRHHGDRAGRQRRHRSRRVSVSRAHAARVADVLGRDRRRLRAPTPLRSVAPGPAARRSAAASTASQPIRKSSRPTSERQTPIGTSAARPAHRRSWPASPRRCRSMIKAANNGGILAPADVRRLLSSATLGTLPQNPLGAKIGPMPDLRRITRALGLQRILPVGRRGHRRQCAAHRASRCRQPDGAPALHAADWLGAAGADAHLRRLHRSQRPLRAYGGAAGGDVHRRNQSDSAPGARCLLQRTPGHPPHVLGFARTSPATS